MRIVVDTNVYFSAVYGRGHPRRILEAARGGAFELLASQAILAELRSILRRDGRTSRTRIQDPDRFVEEMTTIAELGPVGPVHAPMLRDPDDQHVLACAFHLAADLIVTADKDLLVLREFEGIPIVTPLDCLRILGLASS